MINLTTEQKSRRLTEYEKRSLYNKLQSEPQKIRDAYSKKLTDYLTSSILPKVLPAELIELGKKPYCGKISRFHIDAVKLGLPETYQKSKSSRKTVKVNYYFESDIKIAYSKKNGNSGNDLTDYILEKCSPEEIDHIKDCLIKYAELSYDYQYFGEEEGIYASYGWNYFSLADTWGQLQSKYPKYFEVFWESRPEEDKSDDVLEIINKVKDALG